MAFVVIVLLALFFPVMYNFRGKIGEKTDISLKISYFFWIFRVIYVQKNGKTTTTVKIGPFNMPTSPPRSRSKKKPDATPFDASSLLKNIDIKPIISIVGKFVKKICKKIKPKHFQIRGHIGFGDPCRTGMFIGFYEALSGSLGLRHSIDLCGDFDQGQSRVALDVKIKGRFSLFSILWQVLWLVTRKPVRDGLRLIKRRERTIT